VRLWLRARGVRFCGGKRVAHIAPDGASWVLRDASDQELGRATLLVVAAALGSAALLNAKVQLQPVRGQVTWAPRAEDDARALPPFPVNGHGHFLPRVPLVERDAWITGSTYGPGDSDESLRSEDNGANLERVREVMPQAAEVMQAAFERKEINGWSGVRCASRDRRPVLGAIAPGLWISTAMGSRGLTFAALCAELMAARLHGEPLPLEQRLAQALDLSRQAPARSG
jgi:tRNA 5-methylaminomethyl-2-thiouridine biosynthesis bifunctional protein